MTKYGVTVLGEWQTPSASDAGEIYIRRRDGLWYVEAWDGRESHTLSPDGGHADQAEATEMALVAMSERAEMES